MGFEIKAPGFYKNGQGKKIEVVGKGADGCWVGTGPEEEKEYCRYSEQGVIRPNVSNDRGPCDLVAEWKEPKRIKGWMNVYDGVPCYAQAPVLTREEADSYAKKATADGFVRLACIEIDVLEGQGLDGGAR